MDPVTTSVGYVFRLAVLSVVSLLATAVLIRGYKSLAISAKGPPGPPSRFLVGNLYDLPGKDVHIGLARLAEKYGPVMMLNLPTSKMIVLSKIGPAVDLLEKQGSIFADRPDFPMIKLMGWGWSTAIEHYGPSWRAHRKIMHQHLSSVAVKQYAEMQTHAAHILALDLLEEPIRFEGHIRRSTAASILEATYGFKIERRNDPFVKLVEEAMDSVRKAMVPGRYIVDLIPALKYVPEWFPGARFKRDARKWRRHAERLLTVPFARAKADMERGVALTSLVSEATSDGNTPEWDNILMEAAGIMYLGGGDTTVATLTTFFLEMILHPEIQYRAQDELSRVVGDNRLPTLGDRESLPYIEAVIRELFRMHPVGPMGIPHRAQADTTYDGMLITEGTIIYTNIWAILHDSELYADPHIFNPDRFLRDGKIDDSVTDPRCAVFGFGRRMCPGIHFADANLYITIATILACFNLSKAVNNGMVIEPSGEFEHGLISVPVPFQCSITPRSHNVQSLISHALEMEK